MDQIELQEKINFKLEKIKINENFLSVIKKVWWEIDEKKYEE